MTPIINDSMLGEYLYLQKKIKELTQRYDNLKMLLKDAGSFCTNNYACVVYEQERRAICGLQEAIAILGAEELRRLGMIKNSKFLVVKVATIVHKQPADL